MGPFFKCHKCGVLFNSDEIHHGDDTLDADALRASWHKAIDKLNEKLADPSTRPEQLRSAEDNERVACVLYMKTKCWNLWGVPDTLVTIRDSNGHRLECRSHHPEMKE